MNRNESDAVNVTPWTPSNLVGIFLRLLRRHLKKSTLILLPVFLAWILPWHGGPYGLIVSLAFFFGSLTFYRLSPSDWLLACCGLVLMGLKMALSDPVATGLLFRVYFGFYLFLGAFNRFSSAATNALRLLLRVSVLLLFVEALLVNTILDPGSLVTFPNFSQSVAKTEFFGFYQRPHGFGYSASITGATLVVLTSALLEEELAGKEKRRDLSFCLTGLVILCSGQAFAMFGLMVGIRGWRLLAWSSRVLLISVTAIGSVAYLLLWRFFEAYLRPTFLFKLSPEYLSFLVDFKSRQMIEVLSSWSENPSDVLIGKWYPSLRELDGYGGDFGLLEILRSMGVLGVALYFGLFVYKARRVPRVPILLALLTFLHYSMIASIPGQIVIAYILCRKGRTDSTCAPRPPAPHSDGV